jgi:hypothetical protein
MKLAGARPRWGDRQKTLKLRLFLGELGNMEKTGSPPRLADSPFFFVPFLRCRPKGSAGRKENPVFFYSLPPYGGRRATWTLLLISQYVMLKNK